MPRPKGSKNKKTLEKLEKKQTEGVISTENKEEKLKEVKSENKVKKEYILKKNFAFKYMVGDKLPEEFYDRIKELKKRGII